MTHQFTDVIPMEQEISNTKRQIDDIEWEGGHCSHLHKHLEHLIDRMLEGDLYYAPF